MLNKFTIEDINKLFFRYCRNKSDTDYCAFITLIYNLYYNELLEKNKLNFLANAIEVIK